MMQAKRFEELKATGSLPTPTGVGLEILRLARDDQASANDIARVIQADPALTGRTLRLANTGNAAASRRVTNVAEGVSRLGTRTVSAVALGFTVLAGNRSGKCRGFDYQRLWAHSLANAVAAQILCATRGHPPARTASRPDCWPRSAVWRSRAFTPNNTPQSSRNGRMGCLPSSCGSRCRPLSRTIMS